MAVQRRHVDSRSKRSGRVASGNLRSSPDAPGSEACFSTLRFRSGTGPRGPYGFCADFGLRAEAKRVFFQKGSLP